MSRWILLATSFAIMAFTHDADAQSQWTGDVDTEWSNPANWNPPQVPTAETVIALGRFEPSTINIDTPATIHGIAFAYSYDFTGPGPLRFEGDSSRVEAEEHLFVTPTFDVPIVLGNNVDFFPPSRSPFQFNKDIDVNSYEFEAFGDIFLNDANITGQGMVTMRDGRLTGKGTIEPDISGTVAPNSRFTLLGNAQVDLEIDLVNESSFDVIDGGGQGKLEIGKLNLSTTSIPNLNEGYEFAVFPGWDSVTVEQIVVPQTLVDWDTSQLNEGILKINFTEPFLCDLDGDGFCNLSDLDTIGDSIRNSTYEAASDLNQDDRVDLADRDEWLSLAEVAYGRPYYLGDATFDGKVDAADLMTIGSNWQTSDATSYSQGDINFDGFVNAKDLNAVAKNWQAGWPPRGTAVPEPASHLLIFLALATMSKLFRHRLGQLTLVTTVALVALTYTQRAIAEELLCDLDGNETCDIRDIDILGNSIRNGIHEPANDLNADGMVDLADRDEWILQLSRATDRPQFLGDANLDGQVTSTDLMSLASNWQSGGLTSYSEGDFNFDGIGNVVDLNALAKNWQAGTQPINNAVPEPASHLLLICAAGMIVKLLKYIVPAKPSVH